LIVDKIKVSVRAGGPLVMFGGILVRPALTGIKKLLDPSEYGAAVLLGINGLVLIGHGRSDAHAIKNAVLLAKTAAEMDILGGLRSAVEASPRT
jgi:glycerol-3-phosphate acyltransferase PlsX